MFESTERLHIHGVNTNHCTVSVVMAPEFRLFWKKKCCTRYFLFQYYCQFYSFKNLWLAFFLFFVSYLIGAHYCNFMFYRHGSENFPQEFLIVWPQNRWCTATQKTSAPNFWNYFLRLKLHYLTGPSIWWQMLCSMKITIRWMHTTLLWCLHQIWLRYSTFSWGD